MLSNLKIKIKKPQSGEMEDYGLAWPELMWKTSFQDLFLVLNTGIRLC